MSQFNRSLATRRVALAEVGPDTVNRAGGLAYQDSPLMALYRQVATSLWSGDGYYESQADWFTRFQANVAAALAQDVRFPFALAAYARDKRGLALRTSPIALYVEAAAHAAVRGTGFTRRYAPQVLRRADEPAEAIAYFLNHHQGVIPHGLLRGIADTLPRFDEYQLAKYKGEGKSVSLRDVFRLARPRPADDAQSALWQRAVKGGLATPYTWETELSVAGDKRQAWNDLIRSGRLGLLALVRNIRNVVKYGADIEGALSQITAERVQGSGILPFQWYKAWKAVSEAAGPIIAEPMQQAVEWSLADVPKLPGVTLVACDNSGSMDRVSSTRGMTNAEIGNLLGAMAVYCSEAAYAGTFGETFALADITHRIGLFKNKERIDACGRTTDHATNAWMVFQALIRERIRVDRVVLLSDMQCYDSHARYHPLVHTAHSLSGELDAYRQINPAVKVYSINLASQDNSCQFAPDQPVIELAGFSESIFQFVTAMEVGQDMTDWISSQY
ncbi:MAG: TROVE domain-containing protein [Chloroflexota bacterium]